MKIKKLLSAMAIAASCLALPVAASAASNASNLLVLPELNGLSGISIPGLTATDTTDTTDKTETKTSEKTNHIELVLILDRSGSMSGLESDTIGGFNSMIEKEKALGIDANVTTVLFSDSSKTLYDREKIDKIPQMTNKDYSVGGMTALLDAVGSTINKIENVEGIKNKDTKVLFVIITDGQENYSKEYNKAQIKTLISDKQEKDGWEFVFLGANINAEEAAQDIGIKEENAVTYENDGDGVQANYKAIASITASLAASPSHNRGIGTDWKNDVKRAK